MALGQTMNADSSHTRNIILVVIAIVFIVAVGIVAAIAIPAYQSYVIRSQVVQGLMLASPLKAVVAERYASDKSWPASLAASRAQQPPLGDYVSAVVIDQGTIAITFGNKANGLIAGHVLTLHPSVANGGADVVWNCGYAVQLGQDPASGAAARNRTDVASKYLPSFCRSDDRP